MPFSAGTRFGPYEILAPIGAGGTGEVYRAKDTRLKRDVALRVLPEGERERMARFQREAFASYAPTFSITSDHKAVRRHLRRDTALKRVRLPEKLER